jgi:UDP-N-acetylmuramyl pentapeptide phosphotransferase/UDP-N-acetylglucosamine-1-phosphate transferase
MRWDFLALTLLAGLVSAGVSPLVIAAGIPDAPDGARKAHSQVTPTSGGLAIAAGFAAAIAALAMWPGARWEEMLGVEMIGHLALAAALAFAAFLVGLADDVRPLGPRLKFGLLAVFSLCSGLFLARVEIIPFFSGAVAPIGPIVGVVGSALWMFTIINATNFIDGANGLSMGSMGCGLAGLAAIALFNGAYDAAILALAGMGAAIGFLVWNFPRGLIFAGDAGALFIGALAGAASLVAIESGGVSPFIPPLLFFPILADVLLTLAWRLKRGRPLLASHRDHLFQIGLRANLGHARVSLIYWALTAVCALIAVLADRLERAAPTFAQDDDASNWAGQTLALVASGAPFIAWGVLAAVSIVVAVKVRAHARRHRLDGV